MIIRVLTVSLVALAVCACAPKPLRGEYATVVPVQASNQLPQGQNVRWGGEIIDVETNRERTCFEILSRELMSNARPKTLDQSQGRFLACREGFFDPAVFETGRQITVTGEITGLERKPIGEFEYDYPKVAADVVYLWPERVERYYAGYPFYDPFFGPGFYGFYHPYFFYPRSRFFFRGGLGYPYW